MVDSTVAVDAALSPDGLWLAVAAPGNYLQGFGTVQLYNAHVHLGRHHHDDDDDDDGEGTRARPRPMPQCLPLPWPMLASPRSTQASPRTKAVGCASFSEGSDIQATAVAYDGSGKLYVLSRDRLRFRCSPSRPKASARSRPIRASPRPTAFRSPPSTKLRHRHRPRALPRQRRKRTRVRVVSRRSTRRWSRVDVPGLWPAPHSKHARRRARNGALPLGGRPRDVPALGRRT